MLCVLGEMHDKKVMRKNKKLLQPGFFWPEGCFWDFFGMKKAEANSFFVLPNDEICRVLTLK